VDDVRATGPLVGFSASMGEQSQALKTFLMGRLYRHPQVVEKMNLAQQVVRDLFAAYVATPHAMQPDFAVRSQALGEGGQGNDAKYYRVVADYVAGMTDRFASREHERLTGQRLLNGGG
jgi:dGTPase